MRRAITCVAIVALLLGVGCSSCDDCKTCKVPDVVRWKHADAHNAILAANLVPRCHLGPSLDGWVTSTEPSAGTILTCGEVVDLWYSSEYKLVVPAQPTNR
jgi:beta-lactam-binding protein with PASTA domain